MTLRSILKTSERALVNHSPLLLTALGVAGTITTAVLTGKASFKAYEIIEAELDRQHYEGEAHPYIEPVYAVKLVWTQYIPAASTAVLTIASIVMANRIGTRRAAAMAAAYTLSERAYSEYKDRVVEEIGEKKARRLDDDLAQRRVSNNPSGSQEILETGGGKDLFFDTWNGRYFYSSMEAVKQAQNHINYKINHDFYASLADFYERLSLPKPKAGDDLGWNSMDQLELMFSTTMADNGCACIVMDFIGNPTRGYERVR